MEMAMATVLAPCTYPCIHDRFRSDVSLIHGPLRPSGAAAPPAGLHHQKSRTNHRYPYPPPSLFISLFSYWHAVRVNFMSSFYAPASYLHWKQKQIYFNLLPQLASIFGSLDAVSSLLICLNVGPFQVCLFQFQPSSMPFLFGRPDLTCKDWTFSEQCCEYRTNKYGRQVPFLATSNIKNNSFTSTRQTDVRFLVRPYLHLNIPKCPNI